MDTLTQELRALITANFTFGSDSPEFAFSDNDSLIARGIIDSTGVLELVSCLQERYGIAIDDEEVVPENLDTVVCLARFIRAKRAALVRRVS